METISLIASVCAAAMSIAALVVSLITHHAIMRRDRKLHTFDACNRLQEQVFDPLLKYQPSEIKDILKCKIDEEYKKLGGYSARIEQFCAGITGKIYDFNTFYRMTHGFFDTERGTLLSRLEPIIEKRMAGANHDYYENYHKVLDRMRKRSGKH